MAFDQAETDRAIIVAARQHDADHARPVCDRGRAKQRIEGRAKSIFARTAYRPHTIWFHDQVTVRRRQINFRCPDCLAVDGVVRRQRAALRQQEIENAWTARRRVNDDENRGGKGRRQTGQNCDQRFKSARGAADDDDREIRHEIATDSSISSKERTAEISRNAFSRYDNRSERT